MNQEKFKKIDSEGAEAQLIEAQKTINFSLSELPVEVLVTKMPSNSDEEDKDFYIPKYQRNFTWEESRQCKFIESLLMGLPIPFLFGYVDENQDDKTVVVDGVQRLNTLRRFIDGELTLNGLTRLDKLEGFKFDDLSTLQQRRFKRRTLRMVVLDNADPKTQFELFERINTGSKRPDPAEIRRGAFPGAYRDLVEEFAKDESFIKLTPMGSKKVKQREREELVARLFCYADEYKSFKHDVAIFVNEHYQKLNQRMADDESVEKQLKEEFKNFCSNALKLLPQHGFGSGRNQTPKNRFEALAVGLLLAMRSGQRCELDAAKILKNPAFDDLVKSGGSNSSRKLTERVEFVRDYLTQ